MQQPLFIPKDMRDDTDTGRSAGLFEQWPEQHCIMGQELLRQRGMK